MQTVFVFGTCYFLETICLVDASNSARKIIKNDKLINKLKLQLQSSIYTAWCNLQMLVVVYIFTAKQLMKCLHISC